MEEHGLEIESVRVDLKGMAGAIRGHRLWSGRSTPRDIRRDLRCGISKGSNLFAGHRHRALAEADVEGARDSRP